MGKLLTEFLGTFFLVLTIALSVTHAGAMAPLAIGVVLVAMVYMGGHISGAHYNPAVSLGAFLTRNLSGRDLVPYMIAQVLGGFAAGAVALVLTGEHPAPAPTTADNMAAMLNEILFTFALVLVVLNVACTPSTKGNSYYGVAIGLTVMAGAFAGGSISGGAYNPAVGVGLCAIDAIRGGSSLSHVWLYLAGPFVGAVLAAGAFILQSRSAKAA